MSNIFIGMLFVFLDFNLNFNNHTLGLIPDFVGYYLMLKGLRELAGESEYFTKAQPFAKGMLVYTGILYVLDLLAVSAQLAVVAWLMAVAGLIVSLLISYWIVSGIREIQDRYGRNLEAEKLKTVWLYMAIIQGVCQVCAWIPVIGFVGGVAGLIIGICYLVAFNKTKNLFYGNV